MEREFYKSKGFDKKITVPFCPESKLSGIGYMDFINHFWYQRPITIPQEWNGKNILLNFGAVYYKSEVYIDGVLANRHFGGTSSFAVDITSLVKPGQTHSLVVYVESDVRGAKQAAGKQNLQYASYGCNYTRTTGIWQTVWMEYVPALAIAEVNVVADSDHGKVCFTILAQGKNETNELTDICENFMTNAGLPVTIRIFASSHARANIETPHAKIQEISGKTVIAEYKDSTIIRKKVESSDNPNLYLEDIVLEIPEADRKFWSVETPYLYDYEILLGEDVIYGYFALRTFTKEKDKDGIWRICLNHHPIFMEGVLDQGYWPDGLMTPPADAAYIYDIMGMKETGFHMIRKHIKIEPERFYFHCDRLGMIVWQDMVNGGRSYKDWYVTYLATVLSFLQIKSSDRHRKLLSREDEAGQGEWQQEMLETIALLKKHPCISTWVIFNEGWGQFSTNEMVALAREADPTRLIDAASGWYDQGSGDMNSFHNYFFPLVIPRDQKKNERVAVLSEYGGYSYGIPEHTTTEAIYGYGTYKDTESLKAAYEKRRHEAMRLIPQGLCASVYTQVSDIEDEVNGIYTYDRKVKKI